MASELQIKVEAAPLAELDRLHRVFTLLTAEAPGHLLTLLLLKHEAVLAAGHRTFRKRPPRTEDNEAPDESDAAPLKGAADAAQGDGAALDGGAAPDESADESAARRSLAAAPSDLARDLARD
ncbi:hypothetical protein M885DRAFT_499191 [Pelagophyceae sp. CCMP2097]|nr:hypothetical protein M885DRAFT_499191 [Pelagophyceae sp. CCMP2097]